MVDETIKVSEEETQGVDVELKENNTSKDYARFKLLHRRLFTVTNLTLALSNQKSANEGKIVTLVIALMAGWAAIFFYQYDNIKALLPVRLGWILIGYWSIAIMSTVWIVSVLQLNLSEKIRMRTEAGTGNAKFSLGEIWGIKPGGIDDTTILADHSNTVTVKYTDDAIILRGIMEGIIDCEDDGDFRHYSSMTRFIDAAMKEGYLVSTFDMRYDTNNDPIWGEELKKIARNSDFGGKYTSVRTSLANQVKTFTEANSLVMVRYYIFRSGVNSKLNLDTFANTLLKFRNSSRMNLQGVSLNEFKTAMETYYGVIINIEDIGKYVTTTSVPMGECKILSIVDLDNNKIKFSEAHDYTLPTKFITYHFRQERYATDEKDTLELDMNIENPTIFERDFI